MTLIEAIKRAKKKRCRISCASLHMIAQDAKSLMHWLIIDNEGDVKKTEYTLRQWLKATDWEVEIF